MNVEHFMPHCVPPDYWERHERKVGIQLIWDKWDNFIHLGDIPSLAERASTHLGCLDGSYHALNHLISMRMSLPP